MSKIHQILTTWTFHIIVGAFLNVRHLPGVSVASDTEGPTVEFLLIFSLEKSRPALMGQRSDHKTHCVMSGLVVFRGINLR